MKARFFCDHCGCEVPPRTSVCPKCGRFFTSVQCPNCGFEGQAGLFARGCPSCGYLVSPSRRAFAQAGRRKQGWTVLPSLSRRTFRLLASLLVLLIILFITLLFSL